jgi:hypothetical protein
MQRRSLINGWMVTVAVLAASLTANTGSAQGGAAQQFNLGELFAKGRLRAVNREVTKVDGNPAAVYVAPKMGNGIVWIEGTDFAQGTIDLEVRGRDVFQQSFVGVAFHGKDDNTYEAVYLRPFNFRSDDPTRHQHAVQYIALPDFDWPRLRKEFPEEFENPVDQSVSPTDWVPLRITVKDQTIQVHVGSGAAAALDVRKLTSPDRGLVGLWAGNNSDGAYANLRLTPAR